MGDRARDQLKLEYEQCRAECEELQNTISQMRLGDHSEPPPLRSATTAPVSQTNLRVRRTLRGHYGKIYAVQWSVDNMSVVSASQDGKLMVWNANTENKKLAIPLRSAWVMTCAFSPTGQLVACGGLDNLCTVFLISEESQGWEIKSAHRELQQHEGYLSCCRFVDDNEIITSSGDSTCLWWDIPTSTPKGSFMDHTGDVMYVDICQSRGVFVSASCDATAKVWDFRSSQKCVGNFTGHESDVNSCAWFPDTYAFATGSDDASIRLFDTRAYRQLNMYSEDDILCGVTSVGFSRSGKYLFCGYDEEPWMLSWDTMHAVRTQTFANQVTRVARLSVSPAGYALATGSWDTMIRIWA